jgi:hypothetical protein
MKHLSPGQIVDAAEGCADAATAAHVADCEPCRAEVETLLDAIRLAESVPQPEPPTLFWPALAARIGEAVRRERVRVPFWRAWGWRLVPVGATAVLAIAVATGFLVRGGAPDPSDSAPERATAGPVLPALEALAGDEFADDPSWLLVSALSAEVSLEETEAFGALPSPGGADRALLQLDGAERMELAKILREALGSRAPVMPPRPGA